MASKRIIEYHGSRWSCIGQSYALLCRATDCNETEIISGYCTTHYTMAIAHVENMLKAVPAATTITALTASKEHDEELRERQRYQPPPSFDPTVSAQRSPYTSTANFELVAPTTRRSKWFVAEKKTEQPTGIYNLNMQGRANIPEGHMAK